MVKNIKTNKKLVRADSIAAWRLCMGCGACKWACPNDAITLQDIPDKGIRPFIDESKCEKCGNCATVCPGKKLEHEEFTEGVIQELANDWGPILELYEGYAADQDIRYRASSGGVATALALYAIEEAGFTGVLHIKADPDNPIANIPTYSTTREEILTTIGSRYAPAAPCQAFDIIKQTNGLSMFIGKPCDCAALQKACELDRKLSQRVGLIVSIFCAGTPSTNGTLAILKEMGIDNPQKVETFRYRGYGWPGMATACGNKNYFSEPHSNKVKICNDGSRQMTYEDTWGNILSKHGQLRCRLCPDSTGEFADISIGDPWYRETNNDPGRSLILVRTKIGIVFFNKKEFTNFIKYEQSFQNRLPESQKSIYNRRCQIWGRLLVLSLLQIPIPVYLNFALKDSWNAYPFSKKLRTLFGTLKRIFKNNWFISS